MRFRSPQDYIGKIVKIRLPYFDTKKSEISYKARPGLIIGCEKNQFPCDFTYLPISKVSDESKRHQFYDYEVCERDCKELSLHHNPSFIRCHKVNTVYHVEVDRNIISDLSELKPEIFNEINSIFDSFVKEELF
ncbi:TPA: hypothetical protein K8017_001776 [Staphylococcus pseudintermedius]|uniref:hypothetical protein n=1 Tax=Staphylococcus TaxID=1279 RepID=UPI001363DE0A|nr:hypothetical protein [Staphylococcus felis]EIE3647225.1 hypothetical protein [Staphylococcus pseudintermedius]NBK47438.1 hypothetical protein [Staphylococcus delphini]HCA7115352.1 hypothetical protein [Staphylococcus pseudintermedius]HCA7529938.1 hypothetical protein [Staphylococcus pseudintermedius]HDV6097087.1 hypothetical protein [Staphylococcus pseudintermedius]